MSRFPPGDQPDPQPPASSRRVAAKARTRQRLVDAARVLFMERGYEAATIRDIAARAGLSTGAVFASFTDKGDLFNAVMDEDLAKQVELSEQALARAEPAEQVLLEMIEHAYRFQLTQLPLLQAATGLSWSQGLAGPLGHRPAYGRAVTTMEAVLKRGVARGELPFSADCALIAEMLWDCYLANYRRALFAGWGLEALTARTAQQIAILLAGGASAPPA